MSRTPYKSNEQTNFKVFTKDTDNHRTRITGMPIITDSSTGTRSIDMHTLSQSVKESLPKKLGKGSNVFDGSYELTRTDVLELFNQNFGLDPTYKNLEIEIRLSNENKGVSKIYFASILKFMMSLFPESKPLEFREVSSSLPEMSKSFVSSVMRFHTEANSEQDTKYFKIKRGAIRLPAVGQTVPRIGVGIETDKIITASNSTEDQRSRQSNRKRWSFIVDSNTMDVLPGFLKKNSDTGSLASLISSTRLRIDMTITRMIDSEFTDYDIELEFLDVNSFADFDRNHVELYKLADEWIKIISAVASRHGFIFDHDDIDHYVGSFNRILGEHGSEFIPRILNKPTNLKRHDFSWSNPIEKGSVFGFEGGCHVSLKADGVRFFLYFSEDKLFLIAPDRKIITYIAPLNPSNNVLKGTILDVEFISEFNLYGLSNEYIFLGFDCLAYQGVHKKNLPYSERLQHLQYAVEKWNSYGSENVKIYVKETVRLPGPDGLASEWYKIMNEFLSKHLNDDETSFKSQTLPNGIKWDVDGAIITPEFEPYLNEQSYVRKWKPDVTIDFKVLRDETNVLSLYSSVGFEGAVKKFIPKGVIYINPSEDDLLDYESSVAEFRWVDLGESKGTFVAVRERFDKPFPNSLYTANDNFANVLDPITPVQFRGQDLRVMRAYHNREKSFLIDEYTRLHPTEGTVLVDFGSGRGGDQGKWTRLRKVYAVEPDQNNLEDFISRHNRLPMIPSGDSIIDSSSDAHRLEKLLSSRNVGMQRELFMEKTNRAREKTNIKIINLPAQDTHGILQRIPANEAHLVTLFNVLTFFYESPELLNSLLNSVDAVIKPNGHFYVVSMDGQKLSEYMGVHHGIESTNFQMARFDDETNRMWIKIKDGIVRGQIEFMTRLDEFILLMKLRGYILLDSYYMDREKLLSADALGFSGMYRVLKFQKGSNPSQTIIKNCLISIREKHDMERPIRMLSPSERPVHITSHYFTSNKVINLYRFGALGDGSCYIHAILRCFSKRYKAMSVADKAAFVKQVRQELSDSYTSSIHNAVGKGFFRESKLPQYRYKNIKKSLSQVSCSVSHPLMEFIGDQLDVNVYMLHGNQEAVPYNFGDDASHIKKGRKNVVLYWINGNHYEAVGQIQGNLVQFVFEDDHPILKLF